MNDHTSPKVVIFLRANLYTCFLLKRLAFSFKMISSYQEIFYKHWNILSSHKKLLNSFDLNNAFNENKERFKLFSTEHDGLFLDYSKHLITTETIFKLTAFAQEIQLQKAIKKLFDSSDDNSFPKHINLRNPKDSTHTSTAQHIKNLTDAIHNGSWLGYTGKKITDVVTIGVGGAFFGPKLISSALTSYAQKHIKCHYLSDLDNSIRLKLLSTINAETTLFIVISKSFSTIEVLENIKVIRMWYLSKGVSIKQQQKHFIALSTKQETSAILNIQKENTYYLPKDIPGRYSVWSIAGLPLALYLGTDIFQQILDGAHSADKHFYQTSFTENIPVLMALLSFWYQNFWQSSSQAILPFNYHLRHLVPYLQQIDMESNGKSVQQNGLNTLCHTAPIIWGGLGYQVQHSYFQQLCQGTQVIPVDFIMTTKSTSHSTDYSDQLFAHGLTQSQILMQGVSIQTATQELLKQGFDLPHAQSLARHKAFKGNKPSSTLLLNEITPYHLGELMAFYEHKAFVQSILCNTNAFDQWGVEHGKAQGKIIYSRLKNENKTLQQDPSTEGLLQYFYQKNKL